MTTEAGLACPLCGAADSLFFLADRRRDYQRCRICQLVFVEPQWRLSASAERAVYELHENLPTDLGYRRFLARLVEPLADRLMPAAEGLDFGCGPGPTLSLMMAERGFSTACYDPFFAVDRETLERQYDFVTASEVVEHLHAPGRELRRLWQLLRPRGWLGIMTKRVRDRTAFAAWHYKNDPTHVAFFSDATFKWLATDLGAELTIIGPDVVLMRKVSPSDA